VSQPQTWSGLQALWRVIKRLIAPVLLGIVGAIIFGFTAAVTTIGGYGFGAIIGVPAGFIAGVILGTRIAPKDIAITFVAAAFAYVSGKWIGTAAGWDEFWPILLGIALYSITALTTLWWVPRYLDSKARSVLAMVLSIGFTLTTFGIFVVKVYQV